MSDLDIDDMEAAPETVKEVKLKEFNGTLECKQEWVPLFYSASWMVRAYVNGKLFKESDGKDEQWNDKDMSAWIRKMLAEDSDKLEEQGINTKSEYEKWGGFVF
jgi:hypothetical protein